MLNDRVALTKQVKEANDIVDVVGGYVTLQPAGSAYKGLCPFHDDHRPSFHVDPRWQNYRCWACGKFGDVFSFIQEVERVDFREARELLARRAGITLEKMSDSPQNVGRALMLEVVRWAQDQYHQCLLDSPLAEMARRYLGERKLTGETVRRFGVGFAPPAGDWLAMRAAAAGLSDEVLEQVGLVARRKEGTGYYDRFRDRVMFPIRDSRSHAVGFGGRILPSSPLSERAPKYYNSADSPLFTKSEHLFGLDLARQAAATAGYLAVVEGYTDVLMAHQQGICQVVATLGTALNGRHVKHLRRIVPRVVLAFDADQGGKGGVDRALELFVSEDVDLAIASLPDGLDPFDLLVQQGPEPFQKALDGAVDALDYKLERLLEDPAAASIEGRRLAIEELLGVIARAPRMPGQQGQLKRELLVSRLSQRLGIKEETIWARLKEVQASEDRKETGLRPALETSEAEAPRKARAAPQERELLEVLLADPELVKLAASQISPERIQHAGLRRLLEGLYALHAAGETAELDRLRPQLEAPLAEAALKLQDTGKRCQDLPAWLDQLIAEYRKQQVKPRKLELQNQLHAAHDHASALELLRQLQDQTASVEA